jgi:hypothetical protein
VKHVGALVVAFAALAVLGVPAQAARRPCGPVAKTWAQGLEVRVYEVKDEVFACRRGDARRRLLGTTYCYGSSSGCSTLRVAQVAGRFVGYAIQDDDTPRGDEYFVLRILDMRSRRITARHVFGDPGAYNAAIARVVIRPTGAAAWLWRKVGPARGVVSYVVSRSPKCGEPSTLADSPATAPSALWRNGSAVYWREGPTDRHAQLC